MFNPLMTHLVNMFVSVKFCDKLLKNLSTKVLVLTTSGHSLFWGSCALLGFRLACGTISVNNVAVQM